MRIRRHVLRVVWGLAVVGAGSRVNGTEPLAAELAKGTFYEGGIKVPMFISGPAVKNPGRTSSALVQGVDLLATILELCGINVAATVPPATTIDARSLAPLLRDETETTPRYAYADLFGDSIPSTEAGQALRNTQYKFIRFQSGTEAFYALPADPAENSPLNFAALTATQQANYYSLVMRLARYQNAVAAPAIAATKCGSDDADADTTAVGGGGSSATACASPCDPRELLCIAGTPRVLSSALSGRGRDVTDRRGHGG